MNNILVALAVLLPARRRQYAVFVKKPVIDKHPTHAFRCGDIPYRVNEMNASLAAINSKEDGLQLSRALQSTARQWHHGGPTGHQLGTPRIYSWEQSAAKGGM